jgi:hypothetical protein
MMPKSKIEKDAPTLAFKLVRAGSLQVYRMQETQNVQALEPEVGGFVHVDYLALAEHHMKDTRSSRTHAL